MRHQSETSWQSNRGQGFTLVDLVMVMFIISIASAIAVPRFASGMDRFKADATARRVVADLEWARAEAMHRSTAIEVYFDFMGHSYFLYNVESIDRNYVDNWVQLAKEPYNAELVSAFGKDINDSGHSLWFDAFGVPDQTGTVEIRVDDETRLISVDSAGRVQRQ